MPIYQAYNKKSKRWVKYHFVKDGIEIKDVKQRNPKKPFKNVPIRGQRRK